MKKKNILEFLILNSESLQGFTLIEMLAVIVIFIVVGTLIMGILTTTLRTSHKSDVVTIIQQNGNYALSQITKTLRDARGLVSPFPCSPPVVTDTVTVITPDNQQISYACVPAGASPATIASNGASLLDTTQVTLSDCSFTCSQESASDLPIMLVNFSLSQQSSSTFAEQTAGQTPVGFQASVGIRNINR